MDLWLLLIAALSAVLSGSWAQQEGSVCIKANAQSCGDCIQVAESCGWCGDENFLTVGESKSARCDDVESMKKINCKDANCRKDNSTDICSNNGDCVCGTCECKKRENPSEINSGKYCECDNFNCDRSNNKLCGGHGRCECRECICDANYTGSACDCSLETATCLAKKNRQICNGRGTCECGICKCTDPKFQGSTCEICPTCPGVCAEQKDCVQCRAFEAGEKNDTCERDCSYFQLIKVKDRENMPQPTDQSFRLTHCKERDANDCWFYYIIRNDTKEVYVLETLDCPAGPE